MKLELKSVETKEQIGEIANSLEVLANSEGWKVVKEILITNIKLRERQILLGEVSGETKIEREENERNIRTEILSLNYLLYLPEKQIALMTGSPEDDESDYDPYYSSVDQIVEDSKK